MQRELARERKVNCDLLFFNFSFFFPEMEEICTEKDDGLSFQDAKIKDLRNRISKQKQTHKHLLANLDLELKQEQYVARHLQGLTSKPTSKTTNSRKKR